MNRVRQGVRDPGNHTDDWLITYADMITLLLCFFVIFFIILSARKNGQEEPVAARVSTPTVQDSRHVQPQEPFSRTFQSNPKIPAFNEFGDSGISLADEVATRIGKPLVAGSITARDAASAGASAEQRSRPIVGVPSNPSTNPIGDHSKPGSEPKGDRISMLEMSSSAFFGSGSADLGESGKSILRDVAVELKSSWYGEYNIDVEGYSDDTPIATARFPSNWELSTARAAAVVHFFLDQGLPAQKLRAAGYADTRPEVPNRDANGNAIPENQAQNRRVVIRLEKIEKSE